jgi:steroid 5-alpha reductase family enzyme
MLAGMKKSMGTSRAASVALSVVAYVAALTVAVAVVRTTGLSAVLGQLALGTLVATGVIFVASVLADNSSMYDPYWSLQPLAIAVFYAWTRWGDLNGRQILVTVLAFLYALRLTSNFYRDWPGLAKEDFRYADLRRRFGRLYRPVSLLGIHLFPTIVVFLGCLPMYAVASPGMARLGWLDLAGTLVTLAAIGVAFVADEQLRTFRRDPVNRGHCIHTGLWAYSRHPNYLGEMATWWGLWLFALAAGPSWWWTGAGAAAISLMFVFVSVPMMERRALATRAGYREYRAETPALLPRLWRRSAPADAGGDG